MTHIRGDSGASLWGESESTISPKGTVCSPHQFTSIAGEGPAVNPPGQHQGHRLIG
jgi:hypothetical protein